MKPKIILMLIVLFAEISFCQNDSSIVVPGSKGDYTLLSNGWKLTPAGANTGIGELPMNLIYTHDEKYAITSNNGMKENGFSVVDLDLKKEVQRVEIDKTWRGICFNKDESTLFVSGGNNDKVYLYDFHNGSLKIKDSINLSTESDSLISVTGVAYWASKNYILAVSRQSNSVYFLDISKKKVVKRLMLAAECYEVTLDHKGLYAYVSLWGGAKIARINLKKLEIDKYIKVGDHPCEMIITKNDKRLFVADANNNSVSAVDLKKGIETERINSALKPDMPYGSTPNAVSFNGDESVLFIANADNNYLAMFNISEPGESKSLGFIPVGWYPTSVKYLKGRNEILVANGKGLSSLPNPRGPKPGTKASRKDEQYIGYLFKGTLSMIKYPDAKALEGYTAQVFSNTPFISKEKLVTDQNIIPDMHDGKGSKEIKHVFYIIRENRTYDQILGDIKKGNGDSSLCLFPFKVTPNAHKLCEEFTLFDNFYADAEVSADGHNWSTAAYASDYTEKIWPVSYGRRGGSYDFEGQREIASPSSGYIWDNVLGKGLSFRNYGEFCDENNGHYYGLLPKLKPVTFEDYPGFDLNITDQTRLKIWQDDFNRLADKDSLPALSLMRLPNDHTAGTRKGSLTVGAMIADNDYALGQIVETISKSKYWKESIIFVVEDDAQSGSDHIDAHRSVLLAAGPYIKKGFTDHTMYSTSSVLKTIELVLGLKPMTQYDLSATPILPPVTNTPNFNPFIPAKPFIDLNEKNKAGLFGQEKCGSFNLAVEDAVPEWEFNEIVWKAVKGNDSQMPPIVHSAFVKGIGD